MRMDSENMRWTVMAIRIQREVGGNLAETLRTTAATLREREMLSRQVLGALGGGSAVGLHPHRRCPIGLFLYMLHGQLRLHQPAVDHAARPDHDAASASCSLAIGIFWMRKVVKIEV